MNIFGKAFRFPPHAYGLLGQTCEVITEEPLRYFQNDWCLKGADKIKEHFACRSDTVFASQQPRCNTIACVAGWAVAIMKLDTRFEDSSEYMAVGMRLLGTSNPMIVDSDCDERAFCTDVRNLFGY